MNLEVGPWIEEKTPWGGTRRYRMVGGCKEFEPEITTCHGTFSESAYAEYLKQKPEREARKKAELERKKAEAQDVKSCPFRDGINTSCLQARCAFFDDTGCIFSIGAIKPARRPTKGLRCPINRGGQGCRTDCVCYQNGCTISNLFIEREG